ncbi:MAG TPA: PepSY-associated TM helix domain-containing protein, partial [Cellvibrionaceae bacterium]|nr:PepSY-associated TM helix domain-containing protein [Cellvibrionaceae bacterium]
LFFVFVMGNFGRFDTEIDQWMRPELPIETASLNQSIAAAQQRLQAKAPQAEIWTIWPATNRDYPNLRIRWETAPNAEGARKRVDETLNANTAEPVVARDTGGGQLLYKMHYALHYIPRSVSDWLIGICSFFMLVAIVSGVITHKKIFADFFTFRPSKGQRSWMDLHVVLATLTLPFFLMITYSGLIFFVFTLFPQPLNTAYGTAANARETFNNELNARAHIQERSHQPAQLVNLTSLIETVESRWGKNQIRLIEVNNPNDSTARIRVMHLLDSSSRSSSEITFDGVSGTVLEENKGETTAARGFYDHVLGLHRGLFGSFSLRWLYFFSGVIGAIIIASGLVLWIVKRRPKQEKQQQPDFGFRLVEGLNVGTIAGLPIAIAAYFWANRLLPLDLSSRGDWEVHSLFIVWLLALLYPLIRPIPRAWIEQFWLAGVGFLLLPLINAATTERHFFNSIIKGDSVFLAIDIAALITGLLFISGAVTLTRRQKTQLAVQDRPARSTKTLNTLSSAEAT